MYNAFVAALTTAHVCTCMRMRVSNMKHVPLSASDNKRRYTANEGNLNEIFFCFATEHIYMRIMSQILVQQTTVQKPRAQSQSLLWNFKSLRLSRKNDIDHA